MFISEFVLLYLLETLGYVWVISHSGRPIRSHANVYCFLQNVFEDVQEKPLYRQVHLNPFQDIHTVQPIRLAQMMRLAQMARMEGVFGERKY